MQGVHKVMALVNIVKLINKFKRCNMLECLGTVSVLGWLTNAHLVEQVHGYFIFN